MPRRPRAALLVAGLAALVIACEGDSRPRAEGKTGRPVAGAVEPRPVELHSVQLVEFEDVIQMSGTLAADEQVTLAAKVAGRLASIAVDLASPVRRDEVVAQIET